MSAVFSFIENAVSTVLDTVGDAVEWVGETAGNFIESAIDDPLKTVAKVAAIATGQAWALPVIEGVDVLVGGGSIEDALKGAAVSYAVQTGVSFATDSFGATGATADFGSGTTQFFEDGSSIQSFDDGSRLITDTDGNVTASAAEDTFGFASQGTNDTASDSSTAQTFPLTEVDAPVAQTLNDDVNTASTAVDTTAPATTEVAATDALPTDNLTNNAVNTASTAVDTTQPATTEVASTEVPATDNLVNNVVSTDPLIVDTTQPATTEVAATDASPTYNTVEDLLLDKGAITQEEYNNLVNNVVNTDPAVVDNAASTVAENNNAATENVSNATTSDTNTRPYDTIEDLLYDKGELTDQDYRDLTGRAPVVEQGTAFDPNVTNNSFGSSLIDLGKAGLEYATTNPYTTAAVIGGGLALTGALSGDQATQNTLSGAGGTAGSSGKTYTYGTAPDIRRTGLNQLYSAAESIYGPRGTVQQQGSTLPENVQFQSSFQPLLSGVSAGASNVGLGALGQGFSYTPIGSPQTFDISTLTPEQIIQMQNAMARRRTGGGGI